jgi:hypothetical protein
MHLNAVELDTKLIVHANTWRVENDSAAALLNKELNLFLFISSHLFIATDWLLIYLTILFHLQGLQFKTGG